MGYHGCLKFDTLTEGSKSQIQDGSELNLPVFMSLAVPSCPLQYQYVTGFRWLIDIARVITTLALVSYLMKKPHVLQYHKHLS